MKLKIAAEKEGDMYSDGRPVQVVLHARLEGGQLLIDEIEEVPDGGS